MGNALHNGVQVPFGTFEYLKPWQNEKMVSEEYLAFAKPCRSPDGDDNDTEYVEITMRCTRAELDRAKREYTNAKQKKKDIILAQEQQKNKELDDLKEKIPQLTSEIMENITSNLDLTGKSESSLNQVEYDWISDKHNKTKGVDNSGRSFFIITGIVTYSDDSVREFSQLFYQRNNMNMWEWSSYGIINTPVYTRQLMHGAVITLQQMTALAQLVKTEFVDVTNSLNEKTQEEKDLVSNCARCFDHDMCYDDNSRNTRVVTIPDLGTHFDDCKVIVPVSISLQYHTNPNA